MINENSSTERNSSKSLESMEFSWFVQARYFEGKRQLFFSIQLNLTLNIKIKEFFSCIVIVKHRSQSDSFLKKWEESF